MGSITGAGAGAAGADGCIPLTEALIAGSVGFGVSGGTAVCANAVELTSAAETAIERREAQRLNVKCFEGMSASENG